ncbi:MAG: MBL fold metallo-hydrolase [Nanoarchaeota archaeon]|nr:MBL fold metallo-hydrolase [Nanoarchaeota archaeon]
MHFFSLGSGSRGNSAVVESKGCSIMVDAGIAFKPLQRRLSCIGKDLSEIQGVLVTHEHTDHIKSLGQIKEIGIPIFASRGTIRAIGIGDIIPTSINGISINAIPISHDAAEPVGFSIAAEGKTLAYFTDLGTVTADVQSASRDTDALVIESNHDIDMLIDGPYPEDLKQRILGPKGHLSNIDSAILAKAAYAKKIMLAHLSETNNREEVALDTFESILKRRSDILTAKPQEVSEFKV